MNTKQADRTKLLLSRLSKGQKDIEHLLAPGQATLYLGRDVAGEPQAQLLFSFALNLVARLYPVVQTLQVIVPGKTASAVRFPRWNAETVEKHAQTLLQSINPPLSWTVVDDYTHIDGNSIVIGSPPHHERDAIFGGSIGWETSLSREGPVPTSGAPNPVGAYAAACLCVAELWKRLLFPFRELFPGVPIVPLDRPLEFSTFNYKLGASERNPSIAPSMDLKRLTMIGVGAGGGAAAFTLASLPELIGTMNLIEPDVIEEPNLNRYIFADAEDALAQKPKVEVLKAILQKHPGATVNAIPEPFGRVGNALNTEDYRYTVAAVHSREARRELQYETPMVLWDAGATEDGEFRLWRLVLGTTECMWCKHPPGAEDPEHRKAVQLTQLLGLNAESWLRKLRNNAIFTQEEIAAITNHVSPNEIAFELPYEGQRYGDWEASQCGRLPLVDEDEEIPIPFAPVMAGILLAGEIIKEHMFPESVLDSYYWNTLMGRFMAHNGPHRRTPRPRCRFCQDEVYLSQYGRRWYEKPA